MGALDLGINQVGGVGSIASGGLITGTATVLANLNKEVLGIKRRTRSKMIMIGLKVQGDSMRITPVDTGNLVGSAYMVVIKSSQGHGVEIGYTANYALFVHEINKRYKKGHYKFLKTALFKNEAWILATLRKSAQLKPG